MGTPSVVDNQRPPAGQRLIAVTGTNGKTSTAHATREIFARLGRRSVCYSSLGVAFPGLDAAHFTTEWMLTPTTIAKRLLSWQTAIGDDAYLIVEITSHWIEVGVPSALGPIDTVILTSLGEDHLDQHGGREAYHKLKLSILTAVCPNGSVIYPITLKSIVSAYLISRPDIRQYSVGAGGMLQLERQQLCLVSGKSCGSIKWQGGNYASHTYGAPYPKLHQNALLAATAGVANGIAVATAVSASDGLLPPLGRCQIVRRRDGTILGLVDSAHNPEAMEAILTTTQTYSVSRIVVVFGCGGDRDLWKRTAMAKIAHRLADVVVVTDDNPRSENPAAIRACILDHHSAFIDVPGRRAGLRTGLALAGLEGIVVALGMGCTQWFDEQGRATNDVTVLADFVVP